MLYYAIKEKAFKRLCDEVDLLQNPALVSKLEKLAAKYSTTLPDVEDQILETEKDLSEMLDLLTGDEFDMRGVAELKKMLGGE